MLIDDKMFEKKFDVRNKVLLILGIVHDDDNDDSFEVSDVLSSTEQMGGGESNFKAMEVKDDRRTVYSEAVLNPTDVREQQQQQQFKAVDSEEEEVERAGQDRSPKSEMAATKGYEAMTPNTDEQRQFLLPNKAAVIGGGGPQQFVETNDRLLDAEFGWFSKKVQLTLRCLHKDGV